MQELLYLQENYQGLPLEEVAVTPDQHCLRQWVPQVLALVRALVLVREQGLESAQVLEASEGYLGHWLLADSDFGQLRLGH